MALDLLHKHVHFVGIGGISMSALAHILLDKHIQVSGSDRDDSEMINKLRACGAEIAIGHRAENIQGADLVVYTAAIKQDNPELQAAQTQNIPCMERADFLGELMRSYDMPISISGTHGKTTTTSMLACVLLEAGLDPTILVGGELDRIQGNYHIGRHQYMVFEGCEYVDSFLKFNPKAAVILNVDADHLDYFSGIEQIKDSFNRFLKKIPADGFAVVNADEENVMDCLDGVTCKIITYGQEGDFRPANRTVSPEGYPAFDVVHEGKTIGHIQLSVAGEHNISNALGVFAAAHTLGADTSAIEEGLHSFGGTKRRFEKKGTCNGAAVYDDYAHHPTEIAATLSSADTMPHGKIRCIFQPHTYTRTKALLDDFATALSKADDIIITDIYAAREKNTLGISGEDLAKKIKGAKYISDFHTIADYIKTNAQAGDIVITMGAGTITELSQLLV